MTETSVGPYAELAEFTSVAVDSDAPVATSPDRLRNLREARALYDEARALYVEGGDHEYGDAETDILSEILALVFLALIVGQIVKHISMKIKVPYTPLMTLVGLALAFTSAAESNIVRVWSGLDPHFLFFLFLPALIFESAFNCDWYIFKKQLGKILLMAGPMLLMCVAAVACVMYYVLDYSTIMPFSACILFGAIISATDPVAVVALLKELGTSKRLGIMIEGESLLNDGTAMVVFLVVLDIVEGEEGITWWSIALKFMRLSFGGPAIGLIFGVFCSMWLARLHNLPVLETNLTVCIPYICFFIAEWHYVHVSGILALVTLGLYMSELGKTRISAES